MDTALIVFAIFFAVSQIVVALVTIICKMSEQRVPRIVYSTYVGWWLRHIHKDTPLTLLAAALEADMPEFKWKVRTGTYSGDFAKSDPMGIEIYFPSTDRCRVSVNHPKNGSVSPVVSSYEDHCLSRAHKRHAALKSKRAGNDALLMANEVILQNFSKIKEKKSLTFKA